MAVNLTDLIERLYGVHSTFELDPMVASVGVAVVRVLSNDPRRVAFTIVNLSAVAIYVKPKGDVSATSGIRLAPNGGTLVIGFRDDLHLPGLEWYAIADAAASSIFTIATVLR